jgi:hypothetical protein
MCRLLINEYNYDIFAICIFPGNFALTDDPMAFNLNPIGAIFYTDHMLVIRYEFEGRKIGMKGYMSSKLRSISNWTTTIGSS